MSAWLDRYLSGQHVPVWTEITSVGASGQLSEELRVEAVAVATTMMRRCRSNVELLIEALAASGYTFAPGEGLATFAPPTDDVVDALDALEARLGLLPIALRCWYEQVGEVNLMGHHPEWSFAYPDPLVVQAPIDFVNDEFDIWQEVRGTEWDRGRFVIDIAPDHLHKADVSGGPPYSLVIPNDGADGLLLWERHQLTFVGYLRECFRWGGMPGFAWSTDPAPSLLGEVARELLPI